MNTASILLLFSFSFNPNAQLEIAIRLSKNKQYEISETVFAKIDPRKLSKPDHYSYFRLLNNFSLNNKSESQKYVKQLNGYFEYSLPNRYRVLAYLMEEDLKSWRNLDLSDIARDMEKVRRRLDLAKGGVETQQLQKDVVSKLDVLIKRIEDAKLKAEEDEAKAAIQKKSDSASGQATPQKDSEPGQDSGPGKIDYKRLKELSIQWGRLPPREREANMRELTRNMPARYREVILDYLRKQSQ